MTQKSLFILCAFFMLIAPVHAKDTCNAKDRLCVVEQILSSADEIENQNWKDQTLREAAKSLASDGNTTKAISLLDTIKNPDTKALTIRGIGMEAANLNLSSEQQITLFKTLREKSETITHAPSYGIALTYIAMSQAFAGDDLGAHQTAKDMKNESLRNKAFGETAEIQAEKGKLDAAKQSINAITSESFRNKAYAITAKIFADKQQYTQSLTLAANITNPYKKATALQYILNAQEKANDENKE